MTELMQAMRDRATENPDAIAIRSPDATLTRAQLDACAQTLGAELQRKGIGVGDVVAWLGSIDPSAVSAYLAARRIGAAIVVPDASMDDDRLREALQSINVRAVMCLSNAKERAQSLCDQAPILHDATMAGLGELPTLATVAHTPDQVAQIRFTSGSTGQPKAIALRALAEVHFDGMLCDLTKMTSADTTVLLGHLWGVLAALACGTKVVTFDVRRHGVAALADWLRAERVSVLNTYTALARQLLSEGQSFPDLRYLKVGGERLTREDVAQFALAVAPDAILDAAFGATEYPMIAVCRQRIDAKVLHDTIPFGQATPGVEIKLVDDVGREVPNGEPGEMQLCSDMLPDGYLFGPPEAQTRFGSDPSGRRTYLTGDVALRDQDGILHPKGRQTLQVKVRGYRVDIEEVEAVIARHPLVTDAIVVPVTQSSGQTTLECHFVGAVDPQALKAQAASGLPNYMVPHRWIAQTSLPKTASGKPDRNTFLDRPIAQDTADDEWATKREASIAALMREALGPMPFSREDDFFDLGGDSLQAMRLVLKIEEKFGLRLPFETLVLEGASVADIDKRLGTTERAGIVTLREGKGAQTVLVMPGSGGHLSDYLEMIHALDPALTVRGLRPAGVLGGRPDHSIEGIAEHAFADPTAEVPAAIIGYSYGAMVAVELARKYQAHGLSCPPLILIDPFAAWLDPKRWLRNIRGAFYRDGLRASSSLAWSFATASLSRPATSVDAAHKIAMLRYTPKPLQPGPVLLVISQENTDTISAAIWDEVLGGRADHRKTPGDHKGMMRGANAVQVARAVGDWMNEAAIRDEA